MRTSIVWGTISVLFALFASFAVACSRQDAPKQEKAPTPTEVRSATVRPHTPTPEERQALQKECESSAERAKSDPRCDQFQDVH